MSDSTHAEKPDTTTDDARQSNNRISNLLGKLRSLQVKGSPLLNHALIVVFLIGGTVLISYSFSATAESLAKEWSSKLRPARNSSTEPNPYAPKEREIVAFINLSAGEKERLHNQLRDIRFRATHHLDVATFFYARYYMAIVAFSMAAGFAAIFLASISRVGLKEASPYLVTAFVVMTALALYYQSFPGVFEQKKNIEANKALYIKYVNLEDEVTTYCATGEVIVLPTATGSSPGGSLPGVPVNGANKGTGTSNNSDANNSDGAQDYLGRGSYKIITAKPSEFIHYIDYQLRTYNDIAVGFDESKAASFAKEQFQAK